MTTEVGLRRVLIGVVALGGVGTAAELALLEHWDGLTQIVPLVLCALATTSAVAISLAPSKTTVRALQVAMLACGIGAGVGTWEHADHNFDFSKEIQPEASFVTHATDAIFGANPLLAPGAFGLFALLGLAATWRHPALSD